VTAQATEKPPCRVNGRANPAYNKWYQREHRERVKAHRKARRAAGIERRYMDAYRAKHRERLKAAGKVWWAKNRKSAIAKNADWKRRNVERARAIAKRARAKMVRTMPDRYLYHLAEMPLGTLPKPFLEAMRANLRLKRLCRDLTTSKS
jgi:hypothetical protein